jgi:hypothetical protein
VLHSDAWLEARLTFLATGAAPIATLTLTGTPLLRTRFRSGLRCQQFGRLLRADKSRPGRSKGTVGQTLGDDAPSAPCRRMPLPHMPTPIPIPRFGGSIYWLEGSPLFCTGNRRFPCHSPSFVRLFRLAGSVPVLEEEEAASTDGARTAVCTHAVASKEIRRQVMGATCMRPRPR